MIGAEPLMNVVPLQQKGADQEVVTQFPMSDVEALGLLKMDFLGLRNLDVIDKAVELIGDLDIAAIPIDDAETYAMLARGEATGVFQFESSGMREALRQVKPTEFEDLIALVALYRPGPMQYIPNYAARKSRPGGGHLPRPAAASRSSASTYGISIYQEQSMEIAKQIGGFTPAEADDLRKAIGKKIHALMASLKDKFIEGAVANGTADAVARQLWDDMEKAQDYSFNKSHAACYALIAYRTAWLRANHPCEYMAALISSVMNTKDRVPFYVNACHELGIEVLPPDVNESQIDFAVVDGKIRFGLNAVKGVGELAVPHDHPRPRGRRAVRVDLGLHRAGRPVGREQARARVARQVRRAARLAARDARRCSSRRSRTGRSSRRTGSRARARSSTSTSARPSADQRKHHPQVPPEEFEKGDLLRLEKETLGLYVSEHPLSSLRGELRRRPTRRSRSSSAGGTASRSSSAGSSARSRQLTTKRGEPMVFLRLDDVTGGIDCVVFARRTPAHASCAPPTGS